MHESPATAPRERRHQQVVRRILTAATEMIVDGGFDALSINKLAATLDYTPGALYRYFGSKDALIARLVTEVVEQVGADIARAIALRPAALPLARIVACASAWRRFAEDDPNRFGLVAMLLAAPRVVMQSDAHVGPAIAAMLAAMEPLAQALVEAASDGTLTPPDAGPHADADRALVLFAGLQGVLLLRKQSQRAPALIDLDRLYRLVLTTLLRGWGAAPNAITAALESP